MVAVKAEGVRRRRAPDLARAEILTAALDELGAGNAISVAGIMARTDLARKTFYVHFSDLGDVVCQLVRPLRAALDDRLAEWATAEDPRIGGDAALGVAMDFYAEHSALLRTLWSDALSGEGIDDARRELIAPFRATSERLLRELRGFDDRQARAVAGVLTTMNVRTLLESSARPGKAEDTLAALREVWRNVLLLEAGADGPSQAHIEPTTRADIASPSQ
jgi:AcrR family transcriptional regulator